MRRWWCPLLPTRPPDKGGNDPLVTGIALWRVNTQLLIVFVFKVELWCCLRVFKFEIFGLEVGFGIKSLSKEVSNIAWLSLTDCEYTTTCWVWTIIVILNGSFEISVTQNWLVSILIYSFESNKDITLELSLNFMFWIQPQLCLKTLPKNSLIYIGFSSKQFFFLNRGVWLPLREELVSWPPFFIQVPFFPLHIFNQLINTPIAWSSKLT